MTRGPFLIFASLAVLSSSGLSSPAFATDGYFSNGYGTQSKGMAGTGVALPQDALTGIVNPAGMVRVGNRYDVGLALFNPIRGYNVNGDPSGAKGTFGLAPGTFKSVNDLFLIPDLAYNRLIGKNRSIGITLNGNGGMNTDYPASVGGGHGAFGAGPAGVNLDQLFISPTYSAAFNNRASWGVSGIVAYQLFDARGLRNFGGFVSDGNPDNLTDRGIDHSVGTGLRIGFQSNVAPKTTLGWAYQSRIWMGRFKKYSDLFAGRGSFDIPPSMTGGLAYHTNKRSVVAFDVQQIWYHEIHSVGNPFANLLQGVGSSNPSQLLGGADGPGFGWRDMTIYKLGYQWGAGKGLTLRSGVSYGKQPIPGSEVLFNILAPGVSEWHFTAGFTKKTGKGGEFSISAMFSPPKVVSGPNPLEAPGQQTIELNMHQLELEAGWGKTY